jgi:hypothetical protein
MLNRVARGHVNHDLAPRKPPTVSRPAGYPGYQGEQLHKMTETMGNAPAQDVSLNKGEFSWQAVGGRPAIKNSGLSPIELVEFELA